MTKPSRFEYCFLRYSPGAASNQNVPLAAIFVDLEHGTCAMSFAADWQNKVRLLDPDSDLEILGSLLGEIRDRLLSPTQRADMMRQLEDSFSNIVQVSEKKRCIVPTELKSIETFARALLDETPNSTASGLSAMRGPACHV